MKYGDISLQHTYMKLEFFYLKQKVLSTALLTMAEENNEYHNSTGNHLMNLMCWLISNISIGISTYCIHPLQ